MTRISEKNKDVTASAKYTNIPMIPSIIGGIVLGTLFVAATILFNESYIDRLVNERGATQYFAVYFFFFGVSLLFFKFLNLRKEEKAFNLPYIKTFTADFEIAGNKTMIEQHNMIDENANVREKRLILVNRINKALKQIKINNSSSEVANVLNNVAATDSAIIDSSYILIKYLVWLIPIIGFIGTIIGMSSSIGAFDDILKGIQDGGFGIVSQNLGNVTKGLAIAFDTTFLALVLSVILNFCTNLLERKEENLLSDIEDFTTENIINKFSEVKGKLSGLIGPSDNIAKIQNASEDIRTAISSLIENFHKTLKNFMEPLTMELKNLNKANQVNADGLQQQIGQIAQKIHENEPVKEIPAENRAFEIQEHMNQILTVLNESLEKNNLIMDKIPEQIAKMTEMNQKVGELYAKIYNKTF